ncbi:2-phosphosulfolactate phosphatase [Aeribacillus alveayuensis]|uniref:Probable 2-phosphosulfolactate phosphatase n=1 Tax=Aeribacillus alveayuensis TaxID=279215 RepID=A0ABT9VRI2_9BACI|nr:2-phosphosulfolactate phosphatase [Bacillus alveayuensis]
MRRIHVITQKELVDPKRLIDRNAVVIDVFLATSTITFLLKYGYEPILTASDAKHALHIKKHENLSGLMLGEHNGDIIPGFEFPDPSLLKNTLKAQSALICSTNGTKAIEVAKSAKRLYLSSLINGHVVAETLHTSTNKEDSIVLICSGNGGRFSLEDFVGAGQIVHHLLEKGNYSLSDSSRSAYEIFLQSKIKGFKNLLKSETSDLLRRKGFENSMDLVLRSFEKIHIVPEYINGEIRKG